MQTRNPPPPYTPETKAFMRQYIDDIGGIGAFAARHNLDHRTAQRIYSGKYAPSASLELECRNAHFELKKKAQRQAYIELYDVPY